MERRQGNLQDVDILGVPTANLSIVLSALEIVTFGRLVLVSY